jgi:hypothetical protein
LGVQVFSTFVKFTSHDRPFSSATVPFALGALIRLHDLRPVRAVTKGYLLALELDSQFHHRVLYRSRELFQISGSSSSGP